MSDRSIMIGTAGWTIPRAVADQFPAEGSGLVRYANRLGATELNSTFWRRHLPSTFERWGESVPRHFKFAVKMPRTITHVAELRGASTLVAEFIGDVARLKAHLGPVLIQLPPSLELNARRAAAFFRMLRTLYAGDLVCEPRHASWFTRAADRLLVKHDVARVAADPPRTLAGAGPGGSASLAYFRLHGSPVMYRSSYGAVRLAALAAKLRAAAAHARVWCIFDNTASGAAAEDALALAALLAPPHAEVLGAEPPGRAIDGPGTDRRGTGRLR